MGHANCIQLHRNFVLRWFRRKNGRWPKPFQRRSPPAINHQNPYGSKSYATRWQHAAGNGGAPVIVGHKADYREPTPPNHKKIASISEKISEHLYEASEKVSKREEYARKLARSEGDIFEHSRKFANDDRASFQSKSRKLRTVHSYDGDIGLYQDRTLPTTLMMTSESQKQKFAIEESVLKRSNSATLRSSSSRKSSRNITKSRRPDSGRMQQYNDFGPNSSLGQFRNRRNARRTSHVSSKPSNTSDYVSDVETVLTDRTNGKSGRNSSLPWADFTRSDAVLHDPNDTYETYQRKLREALHPEVPPLSVLRASVHHNEPVEDIIRSIKGHGRFIDDRTESQQNTMRSESFYSYNQEVLEEERSTIEGQSSETESMAESSLTATEGSFSLKRRQYNSDNEFLNRHSSRRARTRRKKQCRRSRSDGWDSEPNESTRRRRTRNRDTPRPGSRLQGTDNLAFQTFEPSSKPASSSDSHVNGVEHVRKSQRNKNPQKKLQSSYHSSSLKSPVTGTLIEMPIYSQATWSGPDAAKYKKSQKKSDLNKKNNRSGSATTFKKPPRVKKHNRAGRKLSIGGGGRYFCEYGSLPVDLSKLPKDLVAKLGGQADQLLEPIEHLNFDQLCRPLPNLGKIDGELSARRLVTDRLPPDHRDREVLSNTYELEGTGLVMTDL